MSRQHAPVTRDEYKTRGQLLAELQDLREQMAVLRSCEEAPYRLASIVDSSDDAIIGKTLDGIITSWNKSAERMYGYSAGEAIGRPIEFIVPGDRKGEVMDILVKIRRGEHVEHYETVRETKDGRKIDVSITISPIIDHSGQIVGASTIARDITGSKQAEEALRESKIRFQALIRNSSDIIRILDRNGLIIFDSMSSQKLLGYPPGYTLGRSPFDFVHPDDLNRVQNDLGEVYDNKNSGRPTEFRIRKADGEYLDVETVGKNMIGVPGVDGILITTRDITGRKQAEEALRESEERLRRMSRAGHVGLYEWNVDRDRMYFSPEMYELYGIDPSSSLTFDTWFGRIHPDDCEAVRRMMADAHEKARSTPGFSAQFDYRVVHPDGKVLWLMVTATYSLEDNDLISRGAVRDITERKLAEEELMASVAKFKALFDSAGTAIFIADAATGEIIDCNSKAQELIGRTHEEILGLNQTQLHPAEMAAERHEAFARNAREGKAANFETVVQHRDGRRIPVIINAVKLTINGQEVMVGLFLDITERRRAEEALRESENKFRVVAETSPASIFLYQGDKYIYVNPMAEALTGYSRDELLAGDSWGWVHPEFQELVKDRSKRRQQGDRLPGQYEVKYRAKDGREGWVDFTTGIIEYGGKPAGLAMALDVSERKRIERALQLTQFSVDKASDEIFWMDSNGLVIYVNDVTCNILGYSRDELLGMCVWDFDPTYSPEIWLASFSDLKKNGFLTFETKHRTRDGVVFPVEITSNYFEYEGKEYCFAFVRDITERKRVEEELKAAKLQAELYVDLMGHDINNMNQVSMGFLELAHDIIEMNGRLGEDNIVLLDKAMDSLKNSSQLIDNVRKMQREKMGMYEPQALDVGMVIQDAMKQFDKVPGRNVKITYDQYTRHYVRANDLLKDVFINLIGNAVKHSRGPLVINIRANSVIFGGKPYCRIDVEDNGPGIPDTLKETLFDRLNLTATRAKGKGFGLCLIKMLVDDYQGRFGVEDRVPGNYMKGARFVVMLPAIEK